MDLLLTSAVLIPLLAVLPIRFAGRWAGATGIVAACLAVAPALALVVASATGFDGEMHFVWLPADEIEVGLRLDGLSAAMSGLVAVAGLAVMIHARGYFEGVERAPTALAALLAFMAAMQGLVLADNFITLLVFWELVGALSARLIAFEHGRAAARAGAIRAFLTTRSADLGLYAAIAALHAGAGTVAFEATRPEGFLGLAVGLGLIVAAAGKSAQLPFQSWLSGAMAGPTPVSALLHSATMVAAGVYLLVRAGDLLVGWPLQIIGWLGAITAVAAAAFALAQRDLKRVLASSTTSQLGLMFVAVGAGVPGAAIFHLIAHAAGKAGMFLATGLFQKERGGTSLERLAGVGRGERAGFAGFAIGAASIAAVPPLAAFWSKDATLAAAEQEPAWFALAVLASAGTAAYLLRPALLLWREPRPRRESADGRAWMLAAVVLLATGSLTLGAVHTPLADLLGVEVPAATALSVTSSLAALAAGAAFVVVAPALSGALRDALERQLFTDEILAAVVQRPLLRTAALADRLESAIDGVVDGLGRGVLGLAGDELGPDRLVDAAAGAGGARAAPRGSRWVEERGVDAAVDGLARLVARLGGELPRLQSGQMFRYLRNTVAGITFLLAIFAIAAVT